MSKISAYPSATTIGGTELILGDQGGATVTMTPNQLRTYMGVKKFAANFGDGTNVSYVITHSLGTLDVKVNVYRNAAPNDEVIVDIQHTSINTITLLFSTAPTSNQFRVVVWA
jgi:hypothetical protein